MFEHKSFADRHPVLAAVLVVAWLALAIPPAVIMFMRF